MDEGRRIRSMHPAAFRSGAWASIAGQSDVNGRACYLIRFADGMSDWWVIDDPSAEYEIEPICEAGNE